MRIGRIFWLGCFALTALCATVCADQIILRDGKQYSGKFVRGDARVVEFQILGRIESFKTEDVAQILFKEPELAGTPSARSTSRPAAAETSPAVALPLPAPTPKEQEPRAQQPVRQVPPEVNPGSSATLPAGSPITVRISEAIDTEHNRVGDVFTATLEDALTSGSEVLAPRGSEVTGKINYAKESGRIAGQSELILELTALKLADKTYSLKTSDYSEVGSSRGRRTAATVGGVAALGAIIGAIAGGGKGAAIGAASGAAVGTGAAVLTKGQTLKIPAETILEFRLEAPVMLAIP
jgi:hypothetical protein